MPTPEVFQVSNELGLGALATLITGAIGTTWWFSNLIHKLSDAQKKVKEELTESITEVGKSQEKRDNELDRNVSAVQASLNQHTTLIEQKMNTLQLQMADVASQIKENRQDTNELRERVVRLETIAEKLGVIHDR